MKLYTRFPRLQANSTPFAQKFNFDTYYRISVSAANCFGVCENAIASTQNIRLTR